MPECRSRGKAGALERGANLRLVGDQRQLQPPSGRGSSGQCGVFRLIEWAADLPQEAQAQVPLAPRIDSDRASWAGDQVCMRRDRGAVVGDFK